MDCDPLQVKKGSDPFDPYVAQRIAIKAGFEVFGASMRCVGCNIWKNPSASTKPIPQFGTSTVKRFRSSSTDTEVDYLIRLNTSSKTLVWDAARYRVIAQQL